MGRRCGRGDRGGGGALAVRRATSVAPRWPRTCGAGRDAPAAAGVPAVGRTVAWVGVRRSCGVGGGGGRPSPLSPRSRTPAQRVPASSSRPQWLRAVASGEATSAPCAIAIARPWATCPPCSRTVYVYEHAHRFLGGGTMTDPQCTLQEFAVLGVGHPAADDLYRVYARVLHAPLSRGPMTAGPHPPQLT